MTSQCYQTNIKTYLPPWISGRKHSRLSPGWLWRCQVCRQRWHHWIHPLHDIGPCCCTAPPWPPRLLRIPGCLHSRHNLTTIFQSQTVPVSVSHLMFSGYWFWHWPLRCCHWRLWSPGSQSKQMIGSRHSTYFFCQKSPRASGGRPAPSVKPWRHRPPCPCQW